MTRIVKGARLIIKRTETTGELPTIPATNDHTNGWLDTDIYVGEMFINLPDAKVYSRNDSGIMEFVILDQTTNKISVNQLPDSILGGVIYKGVWDASTGLPPTTTPEKGWYYVVGTSGNTDLDGNNDWKVSDWAIHNGNVWEKVDNTEDVIDFSPFLRLSGGTMTGDLYGTNIMLSGEVWVSGLTEQATNRIIFFDTTTGKLTYGDSSTLAPVYNSTLSDTIATVTTFGGIPAGTTVGSLRGQTYSAIFDTLIFPTVPPTLTTQRSVALTGILTTPVEVGTTVTPTLLATFNRGRITNGDGVTYTDLVGNANQYVFKLPNGNTDFTYTTSNSSQSRVYTGYVTTVGNNNWSVTVNYDAGTTQYYDSKGVSSNIFNASRVASTVTTSSSTVVALRYLWYGMGNPNSHPINTVDVRALSKSFLSATNTGVYNIVIPAGTQEFYFYIPSGKTVVVLLVESNATITNVFTQDSISVLDAAGVSQTYTSWVHSIGALGYTTDVTYRITIS